MEERKRVVITGLGVVSAIGQDVTTYWNNLLNGVCGIDFISGYPPEELPVKIAAQIKEFDGEQFGMDKAFVRKQDRFTLFGVAAAWQAMNDSGLHSAGEEQNIEPFRLGVHVGS
ncbi:MAG: beta-ketoacyl-[acyl-carrier-protein] synthase II, partial [Bacteroidota bacterium]|nr:beta-ketoacyl-[acyl-carrier-protein] synthase II [Bacteroidota bacterium]